MNYLFFALLAAFCFAIGTLISKFASRHTLKNWNQLLVFFYATFNPLPILIVPFISRPNFPQAALVPILFNALFFFLGAICFFKSLMTIDASVAAPLFQIQGATIAVLAFLFLGERFLFVSYIWLSLIILGSIIVSVDESFKLKSFLQPGVIIMVIANILFAISNLFAGFALKSETIWNVFFWTPIFTSLLVVMFVLFNRPDLKVHIRKISPMFGAAIFQFIGTISMLTAFQQNLTISGVLSLLDSPIIFIIAIISSRLFPQLLEHHSAKVYAIRGLGLLVILFGAIKLTLG